MAARYRAKGLRTTSRLYIVSGAAALVLAALAFAYAPDIFTTRVSLAPGEETSAATPSSLSAPPAPSVKHLPTPEAVRAVYMSQCVVGTPSFRSNLVELIDETELNSVVIDIKDYTGKIGFTTDNPKLKDSVSDACGASDMRPFVASLHEKGIYVIGRITVFQDPFYAKTHPEQSVLSKSRPGEPWKDFKGLSFISVSSRPFSEYVVELSKESYAIGFDELNYDYIRWPSDGPMSDIVYPSGNRAQALEEFFSYLSEQVKPTGAVLSADLFGMTTTNVDDLNIGQVLERTLPYFDFVSPMVYPSHYPKSFLGLGNPNSDPYRVVNYSMSEAVRRAVATTTSVAALTHEPLSTTTAPYVYAKPSYDRQKLRPWLQDFDYGKDYLPEDIQAQIQATHDAGLTSYMFWDPGNKYTSLRQVLTTDAGQ